MLRRLGLMACLLWSIPMMAMSITEDGFIWEYETFGDGLILTGVSIAEGTSIRQGKEVTIYDSFPVQSDTGEEVYVPVIAIKEEAIGKDGSDKWNRVTKITFPETVTTLVSDWYSEKVAPLEWDMFYTDSDEELRMAPLTLVVTGPVLDNLDGAECWVSRYDEETGVYDSYSRGYFNLQLPTDATYRAQWERVITDEMIGLSAEEDGAIWHHWKVLDFKPNLNNRVTEVIDTLEAAKTEADDAGKLVLEALKKLIGLQQNAAIATFATDTGFVSITDGVWTVSSVSYEQLSVQPNAVINLFLSDAVLSELKGAITCLEQVPSSWVGQVTLESSDALPLRETLVIDVTDAFLLKASIQEFLSSLHLMSSYKLDWDYTQPIELPPLKMVTIDDWMLTDSWKNAPKSTAKTWYDQAWTVQAGNCDGNLVFRLSPEDESVMSEFAWINTADHKYAYSSVEWTEAFGGTGDAALEATEDAIFIIYYDDADKFEAAQAEDEDEYFYLYGDDADYYYWYGFGLEIDRTIPAETVFESQAGLLNGREASADLDAAKGYFKSACETMKTALGVLASRSDTSEHLFNLTVGIAEADLATATQYLDAALASLEQATEITVKEMSDTLYLAPLFTLEGPERKHLPKIVNGEFVEESALDTTYCGILPEHAAQTDGTWEVTKSVTGEWVVTGHNLPETTTQVELPATVKIADETTVEPTKAGYRLFAENASLRKVTLPETYSVGVETFKDCASLKELVFDTPRVLSVGSGAFDGVALTHLTVAGLPEEMDVDAVEKLRIASGTRGIPLYYYHEDCYDDCLFANTLLGLKSLILPSSLEYIDLYDLSNFAPNLETVSFEGQPPSTYGDAPFGSLNAVGYYPSVYADDWKAVIVDGYWRGLQMETMKIAWNCSGGGSVTITAGATEDGETSPGEELELKAVPEEGMVFVGWSGDLQGTENPIRATVTENMSTTAHFLPKALYDSLMANSGGGVSGPALESLIEAAIKERGLITEDQVHSMNANIPLFKVEGGKVAIKLYLQSTSSLAETWAPMDLTKADLLKDDATGELTITVPMKEDENAAFYKFVVPEKQ